MGRCQSPGHVTFAHRGNGDRCCGAFRADPCNSARLVRLDPQSTNVLLALNGSMVFAGQGMGAAIGALTEHQFGVSALGFVAAVLVMIGAVSCAALVAEHHPQLTPSDPE